MVSWFIHWTLNPRTKGSNPSPALRSFAITLIYICHSSPRCVEWVPGGRDSLNAMRTESGSLARAVVILLHH